MNIRLNAHNIYSPVDVLRNILILDRIDAEAALKTAKSLAVKDIYSTLIDEISARIDAIDRRAAATYLSEDTRQIAAASDVAFARDVFNLAKLRRCDIEHKARLYKITETLSDDTTRVTRTARISDVYKAVIDSVYKPEVFRITAELIDPRHVKLFDVKLEESYLAKCLQKTPDKYLQTALQTANEELLLIYARNRPPSRCYLRKD